MKGQICSECSTQEQHDCYTDKRCLKEDAMNRTNCLGYETCKKYSEETHLHCDDCDNFQPVIEGVNFSHEDIKEGLKRWEKVLAQ